MERKITLLLFFAPIFSFGQADWSGYWKGAMSVQGMELDMFFDLNQNESGDWICTMDVPLQSLADFPASSVRIDQQQLTIEFDAIPGNYEGSIAADGNSISGNWLQSGQSFPLNLSRTEKSLETTRPQEPIPPFPYESRDVTFSCANDTNVLLAGTFTYPKGAERAHAVILVSGSGPQDRNEEIMGHKPFLLLSDYLTRNGIAVLRYDDRGVGESSGDRATSSAADFAEDALGAIDFLHNQQMIDCDKIGIIGHSEGGMVASILGAQQAVDFTIMMAGPGIPIDELLLDQTLFMDKQAGFSDEAIRQDTLYARRLYNFVKRSGDEDLDTVEMRKLTQGYYNESEFIRQQFANFEQFYNSQYQMIGSPWFRHFVNFVPHAYISQIKCPVLALNGGLDFQVPAGKNLSAIEAALIEGPCIDFEIRNFPNLNHLFQPATTGRLDEYARIKTTIDPLVLTTISNWILSRK